VARLVALGLIAGVLAGAGAARDIERSFDKGRIAPAGTPAAPAEPAAPKALSAGDLDLASTHGYALAAEFGFTERDDCRTVEPASRAGCLDRIADRAAAAPGALDPLL
jgi:hypothetical protein